MRHNPASGAIVIMLRQLKLDPDHQHERYLKAGQFSVEKPGQLSVEINRYGWNFHGL